MIGYVLAQLAESYVSRYGYTAGATPGRGIRRSQPVVGFQVASVHSMAELAPMYFQFIGITESRSL